ncbi:hypothetical protein Tsubulata_011447 [Turnera subulata]|uniref:Uncharacterized protein n=1 Tax=Turnera subulata TaxID=218843 RepID=A0A9Q0FY44_9ROSI|nr:hypothetical protein Tsubulata_011447 [Turnera subulata]
MRDIQQLEEYCKYQKANASMVIYECEKDLMEKAAIETPLAEEWISKMFTGCGEHTVKEI